MKLKFLQDRTTKEAHPQTFKAGQVVNFPDTDAGRASAQHWLNRNVAVHVDEPPGPAKLMAPEPPEDEPKDPIGKGPPRAGR